MTPALEKLLADVEQAYATYRETLEAIARECKKLDV